MDVRFPLHYATLQGDEHRVRYLLGVSPGIEDGTVRAGHNLGGAGGNRSGGGNRRSPNMRADDEDDLGRTPLHIAAAFGHTAICKVFLDLDSSLVHSRAEGMQVYMYIYRYKYTYTYICIYIIYIYIYMHNSKYMYTYVRIFMYIYAYMYICIYTHICTRLNINVHVYTYI